MELNPAALRLVSERCGLSVSALAWLAGMNQPDCGSLELGRRRLSAASLPALVVAVQMPLFALPGDSDGSLACIE